MAYSATNTNFNRLSKRVEDLNTLMVAVVVVLLIGFVTMFITVYGIFRDNEVAKQETFQDLKDQVKDQNAKIDALTKTIETQNQLQAQKP